MQRILLGCLFALLCMTGNAFALCSSYPYTLTNGTTADATQVMANFNCAALTSGATLGTVTLSGVTTFPGTTAVSSTGNLGVGTTTPPAQLVVGNNTTCSSAGACSPAIVAGQGTGGNLGARLEVGFNYSKDTARANFATLGYVTTDTTGFAKGDLYFTTRSVTTDSAPSERMRITSAGDVYVGTSSIGTIGSVSGFGAFASGAIGAASTGDSVFSRRSSNGDVITFRRDTTNVGSISVSTTNTAYNTTSDERLKNWNIAQTDHERAIRGIWVGEFAWKATGKRDFGIRAQQAYQFFPAAIHRPDDEQAGRWEADYGRLAPLALWGVQKLYQTTDSLRDQMVSTQSDVKALAREVSQLREMNEQSKVDLIRLRNELSSIRRDTVRTAQR